MSDLDLDLDLDTVNEVAPVAEAAPAKPKAKAKAAAAEGEAPSLASILSGGTRTRTPRQQRELKEHDRMPRDVLQERFTKKSGLEPRQAKAILNSVESFIEDTLKVHSIRWAGMTFKHSARAGRVNPNLQKQGEFSFTPAHLRVEAAMPLMPNEAIQGRRHDDAEGKFVSFEAGAVVDGVFVPNLVQQAQIEQQQAVVDAFQAERRAKSPMARAAAAKNASQSAAGDVDMSDVSDLDTDLEADLDLE